jgi:hypothetical protein
MIGGARGRSIVNGDLAKELAGWRVVSGIAFAKQPVCAEAVGAADVQIKGSSPVTLGDDFWYTTAYSRGYNGMSPSRMVTARASGVLDSDRFTVSQWYLAYCIGGSAGAVRRPRSGFRPRPPRHITARRSAGPTPTATSRVLVVTSRE